MEKSSKRMWIKLTVFIAGMLSVSISNFFGGYYCSSLIITMILTTMYIYDVFEKETDINKERVSIILMAVVTTFQILFFIINDIFNFEVYRRNDLNFIGVLVIISQLFSIGALVYELSFFYKKMFYKGTKIEFVEDNLDVDTPDVSNSEDLEHSVVDNKEKSDEVKYISYNKEVPFMEEE